MERMTPLDAGFWQLEDGHVALHLGCVATFAGPTPEFAAILRRYAGVVASHPRYRQRMRTVALDLKRPGWVDVAKFDVADHVLHTAVPAPGGERELTNLIGRIMSTRLDPDRPLWQVWVVDGLAGGWAIVWKVHHSVVDGVGGMELLTGMLDGAPGASRTQRAQRRSAPGAVPRTLATARILSSTMTDTIGVGRRALRSAATAGGHPRRAIRELVVGAQGGVAYLGAATHPVTATSLNGPLGSTRDYRVATVELADAHTVRTALGGSVNDVALTMITRGFRDLLLSRHEDPLPRAVRTLVPVSVRSELDRPATANKVSALLLDLPVDYGDSGAAYGAVAARMRTLKASGEAAGGVLITTLARWVPAPAVSATVRAARRLPQHVVTTVTTNVPGPRSPVQLLGQDMLALYPYVPIAEQIRIGIAMTSYNGRLHFGVTSDHDSVPDVGVLVSGLTTALQELVEYAARTEAVRR